MTPTMTIPLPFLKEILSYGSMQTIDVMFPMSPYLYALAPNYIKLLLEPVLSYVALGRWLSPFFVHDVGTHYPNATGHDDGIEEDVPIEETGNLLILAYMYELETDNRNQPQRRKCESTISLSSISISHSTVSQRVSRQPYTQRLELSCQCGNPDFCVTSICTSR